MTTDNDVYTLLVLLPSTPYTLAYALPLFLVSALVTCAGAFLTLDRTRVFPKTAAAQTNHTIASPSSLSRFPLGGGIGGLCSGYAFGVHFSTLISLLLPSTTQAAPLGRKAFLTIWILSAIPCVVISGRWKYAALALSGLSGFAALALALCVIIHPQLVLRIALVSVLTVLGTIACLLPFPRYARYALRVADASLGAFGLVVAIALFSRIPAWANVWDRLWVHDGMGWGTSKEKGLSATYCFILAGGLIGDWLLHHKVGENPDEKWDQYLAEYTSTLPIDPRRAGIFTPFTSWWDRLSGRRNPFAPITQDVILPTQKDSSLLHPRISETSCSEEDLTQTLGGKAELGILRKKGPGRRFRTKRTGRTIKFKPHYSDSSGSDDEMGSAPGNESSATLVNGSFQQHGHLPLLSKTRIPPDCSDLENDISDVKLSRLHQIESAWQPEFIRRHTTRRDVQPHGTPSLPSRAHSEQSIARSDTLLESSTTRLTSVPATPSLIRAVERIQTAHELASQRGQPSPASASSSNNHLFPTPPDDRDDEWASFWQDVRLKASGSRH